ncbi:uncharacterized protein HD556DRAFT_1451751 [Suillus plorans]|uniref:Uncharacterized protein n=1 Tax=Suillus plorans TaxID=116603 RepID=A0A9P7A8M0_9AGAM|nr:uncharacterized protein HD556DRAFT_1451751 [Suillus plorans]KAG1784464.1 hypothetical protein HD556DRAFT_1451751 [Suillus plorans]
MTAVSPINPTPQFSTASNMTLPLTHATCAIQEYPGTLLSQNHWIPTYIQSHSSRPIQLKDILVLEDQVQLMYHYTGVVDKILGVQGGCVDIRVQKDRSDGPIPPITLTMPLHYFQLPFHWRLKCAYQQLQLKITHFYHCSMLEPVYPQTVQGDLQAVLDSLAAEYPEGSCKGIPENLLEDDDYYFKVVDSRPHHYRYT